MSMLSMRHPEDWEARQEALMDRADMLRDQRKDDALEAKLQAGYVPPKWDPATAPGNLKLCPIFVCKVNPICPTHAKCHEAQRCLSAP